MEAGRRYGGDEEILDGMRNHHDRQSPAAGWLEGSFRNSQTRNGLLKCFPVQTPDTPTIQKIGAVVPRSATTTCLVNTPKRVQGQAEVMVVGGDGKRS